MPFLPRLPALARGLVLLPPLWAGALPAWEASSDGRLCLLDHSEPHVEVRLTYDPSGPLYSISLTRTGADWPDGPVFAIAFARSAPLTISTSRHQVAGPRLRVTDTGFGNVLRGLAFNETATALLAGETVPIDLTGARPAVEAFEACTRTPAGSV